MTGAGQTARLEATALSCVRGDRLLFERLDLLLEPGGAALITGANGAGKSSLLRILGGLLAPTAGAVAREGRIALAGEAMALDPMQNLTAALGFWASLDGGAERLAAALAAMGLDGLADVPVSMLSTGQRKRATLARVIAGGAPIWLLDEPGNGLDNDSLGRLAVAMAAHRAGGGIAVVASHQPLDLGSVHAVRL